MRERISIDSNWRFSLGHAGDRTKDFEFARDHSLVKAGEARGAAGAKFDDAAWQTVHVPHDWAIDLPLDPAGDKELCDHGFRAVGPDHPENSVGWYRKTFELAESDRSCRITIEFDGVFRDSIVWVNGHRMGRHESGYTSFAYDISDVANFGGANVIAVRVDATQYEGWWYEGAGIYRHVRLVKTAPVHVARWGVQVISEVAGSHADVLVRTRVMNETENDAAVLLASIVSDGRAGEVASGETRVALTAWSEAVVEQKLRIEKPELWSCETPHLYSLRSEVRVASDVVDVTATSFGVRTLRWDAKTGFYLNGKPLKIKGTCNHQCHAGVGVAVPDRLHEWRIEKLKEMGSNAYRCSHYMVAAELLDLCDREGILVVAENRLAGSSPANLADFKRMIVRDRNHPSIIAWSLANEEHTLQWSEVGERVGRTMVNLAHKLDPTRTVTTAMHDRGLGAGFTNVVDVHGWNYIGVGDITGFHERRPEQPILGSEEGSTVCTRGVYDDDAERGYVSAYDKRTPKWGATAEKWWSFFAERQWLAGGFVWTGFDYFGEPIPYKWPCTASHFGLMDLCGFRKDNFYYYQAWWSDKPVLHLLPHWNWAGREGQEIDVRCFTNCASVELFLNGRSLGVREVKPNSHAAWNVMYEPGKLVARGTIADGVTIETAVATTGPAVRLVATPDRNKIVIGRNDVSLIKLAAVDAVGRVVPTAMDGVTFDVTGGVLLGVGNGDPSSHDSNKGPKLKLFNGLGLAIAAADEVGTIRITVKSPTLGDLSVELQGVVELSAASPAKGAW